METLLKADIFFFISSLATIIITVFASVLLYYLIKTGRNLYSISEALKSDFEESEEFIEELRERLESNFIFQLFFPLPRRKRESKKQVK